MAPIEDDVAANYRALRVERGLTWAQLAEQVGAQGDRGLAAWCRKQDDIPAGLPKGRAAAPKVQA